MARNFYLKLYNAMTQATVPAMVHGSRSYSYAELLELTERANSVLGQYRQERVVIYAEKSLENYAATFAVALSENVRVPVNPDLPDERILEIIKLTAPKVVFTDRALPEKTKALVDALGAQVVNLLKDSVGIYSQPRRPIIVGSYPEDDLAYIMFTSGSTGTPKGVPMTHLNFSNFIEETMKVLPLSEGEVFSDYHDYGFDLTIFYLYCCVLTKSTFAPALTREERLLPYAHLLNHKVSVCTSTPSLINRIRASGVKNPELPQLKIMFFSGEPFRMDLLRYCLNELRSPHVYNFYGLTETGVENFFHKCSTEDLTVFADCSHVPIGRPLPGTFYRLGPENELWLSGCQITPGYLAGVSAEKFVEEKNNDGSTLTRWYRTGDRASESNGVLHCHGRLDNQVKYRGYRIELGEVETRVRQIQGVDDCVCFIHRAGESEYLAAAIRGESYVTAGLLKRELSRWLPGYMIPGIVRHLPEFPLNHSGKTDRLAIAKMLADNSRHERPEPVDRI